MKKIRFIMLLACLLVMVMTFNACSGKISKVDSFDVVLNSAYKPQSDKMENISEVEELYGYQFLEAKGEFMTFAKFEEDMSIRKSVFSTRNKKVVYSAVSNSSETVEIKLFLGISAFTVTRTQLTCADENCEREAICEFYDATGTLVKQMKGASPDPITFADTVIFNFTSYSVKQENGALSKIADIPENLYIENCNDWNDKYFYVYGDTINVYDRGFNHVYSWTQPSWANSISKNMLDNGMILVQYTRPLDNNAKKYDLYEMDENTGETKKFDVYTILLDPEKSTEKEIKMNYIVEQVTTGTELIRSSENNGMYCAGIENIAYVFPIIDHQVDTSQESADIVLMDNKGKLKKSLKIVDGQRAVLPTCIGENVYIISTVYGMALVDIDGNILHQLSNNTIHTVGNNIVSDSTIYTLNMEEVYSMYDNGASILTYIGETILVKEGSESEYSVIAINGTEKKEIAKYNLLDPEDKYFDELEDVGCYVLCNVTGREYKYYNSNHELIYTSSVRLDIVASDFGTGVSVFSTTVENEITYYVIY